MIATIHTRTSTNGGNIGCVKSTFKQNRTAQN